MPQKLGIAALLSTLNRFLGGYIRSSTPVPADVALLIMDFMEDDGITTLMHVSKTFRKLGIAELAKRMKAPDYGFPAFGFHEGALQNVSLCPAMPWSHLAVLSTFDGFSQLQHLTVLAYVRDDHRLALLNDILPAVKRLSSLTIITTGNINNSLAKSFRDHLMTILRSLSTKGCSQVFVSWDAHMHDRKPSSLTLTDNRLLVNIQTRLPECFLQLSKALPTLDFQVISFQESASFEGTSVPLPFQHEVRLDIAQATRGALQLPGLQMLLGLKNWDRHVLTTSTQTVTKVTDGCTDLSFLDGSSDYVALIFWLTEPMALRSLRYIHIYLHHDVSALNCLNDARFVQDINLYIYVIGGGNPSGRLYQARPAFPSRKISCLVVRFEQEQNWVDALVRSLITSRNFHDDLILWSAYDLYLA